MAVLQTLEVLGDCHLGLRLSDPVRPRLSNGRPSAVKTLAQRGTLHGPLNWRYPILHSQCFLRALRVNLFCDGSDRSGRCGQFIRSFHSLPRSSPRCPCPGLYLWRRFRGGSCRFRPGAFPRQRRWRRSASRDYAAPSRRPGGRPG